MEATANCLYCRRSSVGATLLVTYSYCAASDTCLQDRWLYIDRPCSSGWIEGKKLNMEGQCKPKATSCHPFKSDNKTAGAWQFNFTETLGPNEYCKIEVDATAYIARVVLDDSVTLGALSGSKEIKVGEIVEVPKGQTKTILAYNGDTSGSITFTLAFRSARWLHAGLAFMISLVLFISF